MLALLARYPALRRLWLGEVVSLLGDWLTYVAISVLALERGEGLRAVALVLVAHTLPNAALSPLAGFVIDRFDRRTVVVTASVTSAAATAAMAAAAASGNLLLAQLCLFARTALSAFHQPAAHAILARIVPAADLLGANALLAATWSVVFTFGVAAGGFLAALVGPVTAITIDAATFLLAAAILAGLPSVRPDRDLGAEHGRPSVTRDLLAAWRHAKSRPELARVVLGKTPVGLATGGAWVLLNHIGQTAAWTASTATAIGILHAARATGTGIGPVFWRHIVVPRWPLAPFEVTTLTAVAGIACFLIADNPVTILASVLLWGFGTGANWVVTSTRIQQLAPDAYRGRLSAIDFLGLALGLSTGAWTSAVLGEHFGPRVGTAALALACLLVTAVIRATVGRDRSPTSMTRDPAD